MKYHVPGGGSLILRAVQQLKLLPRANQNLNFKVFVLLHYDGTIFYRMKNISRTSELPVRSCENRRFPL